MGKMYPSFMKLNNRDISFLIDHGNPLPFVVLKSISFWQAGRICRVVIRSLKYLVRSLPSVTLL